MTIISDCGTYRYTLTRHIPCALRWVKPLLFILLNPSTATAQIPDPTTDRCVGYAKSWLCTNLTIVNLFAFRASEPTELLKAADPIGPENDMHLLDQIEKHNLGEIVLGWGNNKLAQTRVKKLQEMLNGRPVHCLMLNKNGSPRHPLYCKGDLQMSEYLWK
jgi:hypothetical protein